MQLSHSHPIRRLPELPQSDARVMRSSLPSISRRLYLIPRIRERISMASCCSSRLLCSSRRIMAEQVASGQPPPVFSLAEALGFDDVFSLGIVFMVSGGCARARRSTKDMKSFYFAIILAITGLSYGQEQPAFISISPAALEHISHVHAVMSDSGSKHLSISLTTGIGAKDSERSLSYSIRFESLIIGGDDAAPLGTIPIKIRDLEFRVTPTLIKRLKKSTIDLVHVLSTDGKVDEIALVLRPSEPVVVERYESEKEVEQGVGEGRD